MRRAIRDVIEFHEKACGPLADEPPGFTVHPGAASLRMRLVAEESLELMEAIERRDLAEVADGCADLIYVAIGTALSFGIDLGPVWDAVHAANVAKFADGVRRDATGKAQKPPGWQHPNIAAILERQRPLSEIYGSTHLGDESREKGDHA